MCRGKTINRCFASYLRLSTTSNRSAVIGCAWDRESRLCVSKVPAQSHPDEHRFFHTFKEMSEIIRREQQKKEYLWDLFIISSGVVVSYIVGVYMSGKLVGLYLKR